MIYIIRHGQTDLNKERLLQGRSDEPLNGEGIRQAEEAASWFRSSGIVIDRVISSPLGRAVQTAKIITGGGVSLETDDRLLEMDYGPYEGTSLLDPPPEIITFFSDFVNNPAPAGMEPLDHVVQRLGGFLESLKHEIREGENILISTHAIAMKGALEYLDPEPDGKYWARHIANCEVYETSYEAGGYSAPVPSLNLHKSRV
ncbi:MAG: histidine phosphatase family protein [Bacillota bacterium]|nr:histidine phosphatase family protein [Bacillota bacterium]